MRGRFMDSRELEAKANDLMSIMLCYKVVDEGRANKENFDAMREILRNVGILLDRRGDELLIGILGHTYIYKQTRAAGRRKCYAHVPYRLRNGVPDVCHYSDVVWLSQTLTDAQVAEKIGMKIATYYRHKKKMLESDYYKELDRNRLMDLTYLESVSDNYVF